MTEIKEIKKEDKAFKPNVNNVSGGAQRRVFPKKTEGENKDSRPKQFHRGGSKTDQKHGKRNEDGAKRGARFERAKPEFDQKIINIRRVTRVMAGGRRFSFSVAVVAGNRNGKVGVGLGKASDTSLAIEKAFRSAKKNMVTIKRNKNLSIPHEVNARYCTSEIFIKPAKGKGIVAGSSARNVFDLAGITDVSSKVLSRSKNKINIARATILALREFTE